VKSRRRIMPHYLLSFWFPIDLITTVPWEAFLRLILTDEASSGGGGARVLRVVRISRGARLLRLLRLAKVKRTARKLLQVYALWADRAHAILHASRLVTFFVVGVHWVACCWVFMGRLSIEADGSAPEMENCSQGGPCEEGIYGTSWVVRYGLLEAGIGKWHQYTTSLNWAVAAVIGASIHIFPGTQEELWFFAVVSAVSYLCCAMLIASVVQAMTQLHEDDRAFSESINLMQVFMARRAVPFPVRVKVKKFLTFQHQVRSCQMGSRTAIMLDQLSPFLRMRLLLCVYRGALSTHPFFAGMHTLMLGGVCGKVRNATFAPGDAIVQQGEMADAMFVVVFGCVQVLGESIFLRPLQYFGDVGLFRAVPRAKTIIAADLSELLTVTRGMLTDLCGENAQFQEYYTHYSNLVAEGRLVEAGIQCGLCSAMGHAMSSCPETTEGPDEKVVARWGPAQPGSWTTSLWQRLFRHGA